MKCVLDFFAVATGYAGSGDLSTGDGKPAVEVGDDMDDHESIESGLCG
jgi:hypothetical protein